MNAAKNGVVATNSLATHAIVVSYFDNGK